MTRRAWVPVFGVILAAGLAAQDAAPRQTPRLRSRVDSVLVDVYPTRDGRAVGDLTQSDFELILQDASRANVTFYPIDPAGPRKLTGSAAGWAINYGQTEILRTMATATDGIAIVDTTDIDRRVRRIVDDLSSYYLLGYTPTNTRQDGKFRTIAVRVKRDGVAVRARSGYRELTTAEAAPRAVAIAVPDPAGVAQQNALGALATSRLVWQCVPAESECGLERLGIDRRGPYSGTSFQPASDPLFRRTERLRVSAPVKSACTGSIRLLDRRGNPLPVPLTLDQRQEAGLAVLTGEIVLAPLGQADYLIEVTVRSAGREERCFVAFRIVP